MMRLVDESAGIMNGGLAHVGSVARHLPDPFRDELTGTQLVGALA